MHRVASSTRSLRMCVPWRGSLLLWRNGVPKLSLLCVAKQPPPLPQSLTLQTAYLHAPFEPREHLVLPELHFELCTRCKVFICACSKPSQSCSSTVQPRTHTPSAAKPLPLKPLLEGTISPQPPHGLTCLMALWICTSHEESKAVRAMPRLVTYGKS